MSDREPFDMAATGRSLAAAVAITVALAVFVVVVMVGVWGRLSPVIGL